LKLKFAQRNTFEKWGKYLKMSVANFFWGKERVESKDAAGEGAAELWGIMGSLGCWDKSNCEGLCWLTLWGCAYTKLATDLMIENKTEEQVWPGTD